MACKVIYKGSTFNTYNDLVDFIKQGKFISINRESALPQGYFKENIGGGQMSPTDVTSYMKKVLPKMSEEDLNKRVVYLNKIDMLRKTSGVPAWGYFKDGVAYLLANPGNSVDSKVVRHEIFHMIFNNFLSPDEKTKITNAAVRLNKGLAVATSEQVEEFLADRYADFNKGTKYEAILTRLFNKIREIFGFVNTNKNDIDKLFSKIDNGQLDSAFQNKVTPARFMRINKEYDGKPAYYRTVYNEVIDRIDNLMNPDSNAKVIITDQTTDKNGKILHGEILNIPLNRAEAIRKIKDQYIAILEDLKSKTSLTEDEASQFLNASLLVDNSANKDKTRAFDNLVKDIYPNLIWRQNKKGEVITGEDIDDETIIDIFENQENADEEATADTDTSKITGKKNETTESEEINPLSRASEAVKDMISTITYRDSNNSLKRVEPGYVFYKMIKVFSMMKFHTDLGKSSKKQLLEKIGTKFTIKNKSFKDQAILRKLVDMVEKAYAETYSKDGDEYKLDTTRSFKWVGTNENTGYYEFHVVNPATGNKGVFSLEKFKNNTPRSFVFVYETLNKANIPISYEEIRALFDKAEASNKLAEIYTVTGSLREKDVHQGTQKDKKRSESNVSGSNFSRFYAAFENRAFEDEFRTYLKNQIVNNLTYEKIQSISNKARELSLSNKKQDSQAKKDFIYDLLRQFKVNTTKIDIYSDEQASDTLLAITDLFEPLSKLDSDSVTDENVNEILGDSSGRIKPLISLIIESNEGLQRSTSFSTSDGKTKWYYTLSNHAYSMFMDLIDTKIKPSEAAEMFRNEDSVFKFNPYNKFSTAVRFIKNTINRIVDHESVLDAIAKNTTAKPTTYTKESLKDHMVRNVFYQFFSYMGQTSDSKSLNYFQSFFTVSDKSLMGSAETRVLVNEEITNGIKQLIQSEAHVKQVGKASNLSSAQFKKNYNESNIQGLKEFIDQNSELQNMPLGDATAKIAGNQALSNKAAKFILQEFNKEAAKITDKIFNNKIRFDENSAKGIAKLYNTLGVDTKFLSELPTSRKAYLEMDGAKVQAMKESLRPALESFYANHYINSYNLNQLALGDLFQYKEYIDAIKRMAGPFAVGQSMFIQNSKDVHFNLAVLEDVAQDALLSGASVSALPADMLKLVNDRFAKGKKEYETTDAQAYGIPERFNFLRTAFGRSSNFGTAIKPVYHGKNDKGIATYVKNSVVELTNELVRAFPKMKELRFQMTFGSLFDSLTAEEQEQLLKLYDEQVNTGFKSPDGKINNKSLSVYTRFLDRADEKGFVHEVAFKSAVKTGAPSVLSKVVKDDGSMKIDPLSVVKLNNADYRIQLNLRKTVRESHISHWTQLTYFPNSNNLNNEEQYHILNRLAEKVEFGMQNVFDKFGIIPNEDGTVTIPDSNTRKTIAKEITSMVEGVAGSERIADFLNEPGISLNFPVIVDKVSQLLLGHFSKKTVGIKHPGKKLILQSVFGSKFNAENKDSAGNVINSLVFNKSKKDQSHSEPEFVVQKIKNSEGKEELRYYAECYIPHYISDSYKIKDGDMLSFNHPAYNQLMGYRIPSTELHSSVPLKVIGMYPSKENDNVIIVPKEIVLLHGSDFDIDTLYVMTPAISHKTIVKPGTNITIAIEGVPIGKTSPYSIDDEGFVNLPGNGSQITNFKNGDQDFLAFVRSEIEANRKTESKVMKEYLEDLKTLYEEGISNDLLYTYTNMISSIKNFTSMTKPISQEAFESLDKTAPESRLAAVKALTELKTLVGELNKSQTQRKELLEKYLDGWKENKVDSKLRDAVNKSKKFLSNYNDQSFIHKDNFLAKDLTGISANFVKAVRYLFIGANETNPMLRDSFYFTINGKVYDQLQRNQKDSNGEDIDGEFNTDILDSIINAAIDHVKEQKLNLFNVNSKNAPGFMASIAMGVNITDAAFMQLQPSVLEFTVGLDTFNMNSPQKVKTMLKQQLTMKLSADSTAVEAYFEKLDSDINITSDDIQKYDGSVTIQDLIDANDIAALEKQYQFINEYAKIHSIGQQIDAFSKTIGIIQNLGQNYTNLRTTIESYNDLFKVEDFLKGKEAADNTDFAFSNVKIDNIPNVKQALKTSGYFLNTMEKIFQKYHKNAAAFSNDVETMLKEKNKIEEKDKVKEDEQVEEEERNAEIISGGEDDSVNDIKSKQRGLLDLNKFKSLKATMENFIHYISTGIEYNDLFTKNTHSISTLNEAPVEFDNGVTLTGFGAWFHRLRVTGLPAQMTAKDGRPLSTRALTSILADNAKLAEPNKFLMALQPKYDEWKRTYNLVFMRGAISDALEKLELQEDFNKIKYMDIIYKDATGKNVSYDELNVDGFALNGFNDLQHDLLKYSVLKDGLKFGSQNYSGIMSPSIFVNFSNKVESFVWDLLRNKDKDAAYSFDKIKHHFSLQLAINNISAIGSISGLVNKISASIKTDYKNRYDNEIEQGTQVTLFDSKENVYYNFKQTIEKAGQANEFPIFARLNKTLLYKVKSTDNAVYYQKVGYDDGRASYQFFPGIINKGYLMENHFGADILALPIKNSQDIGKQTVETTIPKNYSQNNFMKEGSIINLHNSNDPTRAGMKRYKVESKTIVENKVQYKFTLDEAADTDNSNLMGVISSENINENENTERLITALDEKYNDSTIHSDYNKAWAPKEKIAYDERQSALDNLKCKK